MVEISNKEGLTNTCNICERKEPKIMLFKRERVHFASYVFSLPVIVPDDNPICGIKTVLFHLHKLPHKMWKYHSRIMHYALKLQYNIHKGELTKLFSIKFWKLTILKHSHSVEHVSICAIPKANLNKDIWVGS